MADSSAFPKPGDTIAAKYLIERTIGTGGMSVVFGATHRVTGKRFAIKWLVRDDSTPSTEAAARFIREAQVAGRFQHPNVVEVYDVGEVSGSFYMVMDWLEGESLAGRIERTGRLSLEQACNYLIPCMRGMDEAHSAGIVHRDLKPANIFICQPTRHSPERAKVLDFGVAKLTDATSQLASSIVTKAGTLIGTPYYLSPEQLRGEPVDARTDVYAFGVILYQVLSGQLPYPATTFGELVVQIAAASPQPLRHLVPTLPVGVDELVSRSMMRDPAQRYQDLRTLAAALERFSPEGSLRSTHRDELVFVSEPRRSIPLSPPLIDSSLTPPPAVSDIDEPSPSKRGAWLLVSLLVLVVPALLLARRFAEQPSTSLRPELVEPEARQATAVPSDSLASGAQPSRATTVGALGAGASPANDPQLAGSRAETEGAEAPADHRVGHGAAHKRSVPPEPASARDLRAELRTDPVDVAGASDDFGFGGSPPGDENARRPAARSVDRMSQRPHAVADARPTPALSAGARPSASKPASEATAERAATPQADAAAPAPPASVARNPLDMQLQ